MPHCVLLSCFLFCFVFSVLRFVTIPQSCHVFPHPATFEKYWSCILLNILQFGLSDVFLVSSPRLWVLGKTMRASSLLVNRSRGCRQSTWLLSGTVNPDHLGRVALIAFLPCKITSSLCRQVPKCSRHSGWQWWCGKCRLLEGRVATQIIYYRQFVSFPSCIYLFKPFICISMHSCIFILRFALQPSCPFFISLFRLFQHWRQGALTVGSCIPLTWPHPFGIFFFF